MKKSASQPSPSGSSKAAGESIQATEEGRRFMGGRKRTRQLLRRQACPLCIDHGLRDQHGNEGDAGDEAILNLPDCHSLNPGKEYEKDTEI